MKNRFTYLCLGFFLFLLSCGKNERIIEKFSAEKPYAIQIAKERSFYQAEKLSNRLLGMDIDAYMIQYADSIENDGQWYYILANNLEVLDSAKVLRTQLEDQFSLKDLQIVKFDDFQGAVLQLDSLKQKEKEIVKAKKPDIEEDIFQVINKFPESNALLVQKTFVLNTPEDPKKTKGFDAIYSMNMDLPRGISKKLILNKMSAFSEVIYKDNLYGDQVTLDIGKLREVVPVEHSFSIINSSNSSSFEIAEEYADMILETGDYRFEEKKEITVNSFTKLYGYKVTIEPKKDYFRTYLVLVDATNQYVIFSQSTDKSEEDLIRILEDIGNGNGLLDYSEFYNVFYTMPSGVVGNDQFIGFEIDKLGWRYAKERNYVKWSKEMVGHWCATGHFYNDKKGLWTYTIFDLLTNENQDYIYGSLYSNINESNKYKLDVYGTDGFVIFQEKFNWKTYQTYKKAFEISFGIDRYVSAVNNTENSWFTKAELIERAESLQFEKLPQDTVETIPSI
jgi:hypothetical protein